MLKQETKDEAKKMENFVSANVVHMFSFLFFVVVARFVLVSLHQIHFSNEIHFTTLVCLIIFKMKTINGMHLDRIEEKRQHKSQTIIKRRYRY